LLPCDCCLLPTCADVRSYTCVSPRWSSRSTQIRKQSIHPKYRDASLIVSIDKMAETVIAMRSDLIALLLSSSSCAKKHLIVRHMQLMLTSPPCGPADVISAPPCCIGQTITSHAPDYQVIGLRTKVGHHQIQLGSGRTGRAYCIPRHRNLVSHAIRSLGCVI
jgi:hypothetical protein